MKTKGPNPQSFKFRWLAMFGPAYLLDRHAKKKGGFSGRETYGILALFLLMVAAVVASIAGWL